MNSSMFEVQRLSILNAIRDVGRGTWNILVVDESSWRLIQNVVKEDEILNEHITNIEHIEERRATNREMDAIYILTPEAHIVDCVMADLERRRYRRASLLWTSLLHASLRSRIDKSKIAQEQINQYRVLDVDYFPRESNLVTFRDPWSFPILFHPGCNNLVRQHISDLAKKIVSVCVSLEEYPTIRYFRPASATHEASVLCSRLAQCIQDEIDMYATYHRDFPPPSSSARPRGVLYVLDRSMDIAAPLVHEFTYQAMVHDLLPVKEGDRVTYRVTINEGLPNQEEKDIEFGDKDKVWVANRHRHMKDTIDSLMSDFQNFMASNPHFANQANTTSLNDIKDMLVDLPQFQETKEAYSLHLSMAQESMNLFEQRKLPDLASVEQSLVTGLDEDYKKPKNVADQVVRLLDEQSIIPPDRLRLLILYLLYRDGLLPADITKLLSHANLPQADSEVIRNLNYLGVRVSRQLKDPKPIPPPLFPPKQGPANSQEDYSLSRFTPALHTLLEEHSRNTLSQESFPPTKPQLEPSDENAAVSASHASLRSVKPMWNRSGAPSAKAKQRVIVFVAGGATYSEARACYQMSQKHARDVYLVTSHMLTPNLFIRQVGDLSADKRKLGIPAEQPKKQAPAHLFEVEEPKVPQAHAPLQPGNGRQPGGIPPNTQMSRMDIGSNSRTSNGSSSNRYESSASSPIPDRYKEPEKKKRHHIFSRK